MLKPNILAGIIAGAGGGTPPSKIRAVSTLNQLPNGQTATTGSVKGYACIQTKKTAGGTIDKIFPAKMNWRRPINTGTVVDGPEYTINSLVCIINNVAVTCTRGGSTGPFIVPAGANATSYQFDPISHTAFGYDEGAGIPDNTTVKFKEVRTLTNGTDSLLVNTVYTRTADASQQSYAFNPVNSTVTNPYDANNFVVTGTAPTTMSAIASDVFLLGTRIGEGNKVFLIQSDSVGQGVTINAGVHGAGHFAVSMAAMNCASINCSISGAFAQYALLDERESDLFQYADIGIQDFGRNHFGATGTDAVPEDVIALVQENRDNMLNYSGSNIKRVVVAKQTRRTTGTYTTEAGQSYIAGWGPGGPVDEFNSLLDSAGFDGVINPSSTYGADDGFKWKASNTTDGLHTNATGATNYSADEVPVLEAVASI